MNICAWGVRLYKPLLGRLLAKQPLPFGDKLFSVAIANLVLHSMPLAMADRAITKLQRVACNLIVVDYCLPERNIWFGGTAIAHIVERLTGGEHYRCYREYMRHGALEGLIYRHGLVPSTRISALGGAVMVMHCPL